MSLQGFRSSGYSFSYLEHKEALGTHFIFDPLKSFVKAYLDLQS